MTSQPGQVGTFVHTIHTQPDLYSSLSLYHHAARKSGKSGFTPSVNNNTLKMLVAQNVRKTLERLRAMSPALVPEETLPMNPINAGVQELIEQAIKPSNLCKQDVTWHPWY